MRGNDAFAVLGLRPGAGRAEIDRAYRRLIKIHHPDAAGGDPLLAADINRAYAELRARDRAGAEAPVMAMAPSHGFARPAGRQRGTLVGILAITLAVAIALGTSLAAPSGWPWAELKVPGIGGDRGSRADAGETGIDSPLALAMIEQSVADARRLHREGDPEAAGDFSRRCLRRLSDSPSVALFDSCAAYDEAVAHLAASDPQFEARSFNPSAVTARQVSAAHLVSADYFEAESRLQQIRSQVQLLLVPGASRHSVAAPRIDVTEIAELPEPPRIETRAQPIVEPVAPLPRQVPVAKRARVERQPVASEKPLHRAAVARPATHPARTPAPAQIRAVPAAKPVQSAPKPAPPIESKETPAWQKPIKPAWQRPLPPPSAK